MDVAGLQLLACRGLTSKPQSGAALLGAARAAKCIAPSPRARLSSVHPTPPESRKSPFAHQESSHEELSHALVRLHHVGPHPRHRPDRHCPAAQDDDPQRLPRRQPHAGDRRARFAGACRRHRADLARSDPQRLPHPRRRPGSGDPRDEARPGWPAGGRALANGSSRLHGSRNRSERYRLSATTTCRSCSGTSTSTNRSTKSSSFRRSSTSRRPPTRTETP